MEQNKLSLRVSGASQAENYLLFKEQIGLQLQKKKPDCVAIVKAMKGSGCSPERVKVECMVELAALECGVPTVLVAPQTVTVAMNKKFQKTVGMSFESAFNKGQPLSPNYLKKPAFAAWTQLT